MVLENVRLAYGNACTDRTHSYVASCSYLEQAILEVDKESGVLHKSWPLDNLIDEVYSIEFDGYYWWTLEKQAGGCIVRKWGKYANTVAKLIQTFFFSSFGVEPEAMCVEVYSSSLSVFGYVGDYSITVADSTGFVSGRKAIIGPSTEVGYEDNYDELDILSVIGNVITFSTPLTNNFSGGVSVYTTKAFWIFVGGEIKKFSPITGSTLAVSNNVLYNDVYAATFFNNYIMFNKGCEIYWLNPNTTKIYTAMAINNLAADRSTFIQIYDMFGYDNVLYRLQRQTSYLDGVTWYDAAWSTYNLENSQTVPEVFMIAMSPASPKVPALDPPEVTTVSSTVYCRVYDQFFSPVSSKIVNFTTSAGIVIPSQVTTDINGQCETAYIGDAVVGLVTITAETL